MHEPSPWILKDIRISRLLCDEEDINVTFNYVLLALQLFLLTKTSPMDIHTLSN